ncbi:hypothetical protein pb186bvf_014912 [Paramecium bursaria]
MPQLTRFCTDNKDDFIKIFNPEHISAVIIVYENNINVCSKLILIIQIQQLSIDNSLSPC